MTRPEQGRRPQRKFPAICPGLASWRQREAAGSSRRRLQRVVNAPPDGIAMCQVGSVTQSSNREPAGVSTDAATASFDGHNLAFTVTRGDGSGLQLDGAVHTAADAQVLRSAAEQGMAGRNLKPHRSSPIADRSEKTHVPGSGLRHGARQVERHLVRCAAGSNRNIPVGAMWRQARGQAETICAVEPD